MCLYAKINGTIMNDWSYEVGVGMAQDQQYLSSPPPTLRSLLISCVVFTGCRDP